jgi:2-methylcitrate dehydratase PrpD
MALAEALVELSRCSLRPDVEEMARRSLLNVLGTSIAASAHPFVNATVRVAQRHGGTAVVAPPGRRERLDPLWTALVTGLSAHLDDFDDTHLETVIHPGAATLGAALGQGVAREVDGDTFLAAFALGCEAQLRIGLAMSPWHYDEGWHITGTCGVLGAAVAAGICAALEPGDLRMALGIAASETLGIREAFGTALKPFHPGKAASNGSLAVLLAEQGFTGSTRVLEAPRGYFRALSRHHEPERVVEGLGERWELLRNTFKAYPCGIVSHPAIDAAVNLAGRIHDTGAIAAVEIGCHPLVPDLTGNLGPADGLEARFSTIHGVAAGLLDGRVGLAQYDDGRVRAEDTRRLRAVTRLVVREGMARDAAVVTVELADGRSVVEEVEHARGSLANPLSRDELVTKVESLVEPVLPGGTEPLVEAVEGLPGAPRLDDLVAATTLAEGAEVR